MPVLWHEPKVRQFCAANYLSPTAPTLLGLSVVSEVSLIVKPLEHELAISKGVIS